MEVDGCAREGPLDAAAERAIVEIRRRLRSTGYCALREIDCEYRDGVVVLHGRVSKYYYKQLAQSALLTEPAFKTVVNLIEVSENGHKPLRVD